MHAQPTHTAPSQVGTTAQASVQQQDTCTTAKAGCSSCFQAAVWVTYIHELQQPVCRGPARQQNALTSIVNACRQQALAQATNRVPDTQVCAVVLQQQQQVDLGSSINLHTAAVS